MPQFIKLPSGVTVDADRVAVILRAGLNKYGMVLQGLANIIEIDGTDKDAFDNTVNAAKPEAPSAVVT